MPFSPIRPEQELPAPGICVLCETSRVGRESEEFFVSDVGMIDAPGPFFGRKIVCERCAGELGSLVGMESGEAVAAAAEVAEEARRSAVEFAQHVAARADEIRAEAENFPLPEPVHERVARKEAEFARAVEERVSEVREEIEAEFAGKVESIAADFAERLESVSEEVPAEDAPEVPEPEAPEAEAEGDESPAEAPEASEDGEKE